MVSFILTVGVMYGQDISDVSQSSNGWLIALNEQNNEISRMGISDGDELSGFSSTIIVVTQKNGWVIVYNQKFVEISRMGISDGDRVKNVSGNNIIVKQNNGWVITYDKNFKEISRRGE